MTNFYTCSSDHPIANCESRYVSSLKYQSCVEEKFFQSGLRECLSSSIARPLFSRLSKSSPAKKRLIQDEQMSSPWTTIWTVRRTRTILGHICKLDGRKNSAKRWTNLRREITLMLQLARSVRDTKLRGFFASNQKEQEPFQLKFIECSLIFARRKAPVFLSGVPYSQDLPLSRTTSSDSFSRSNSSRSKGKTDGRHPTGGTDGKTGVRRGFCPEHVQRDFVRER